MSFRFVTKHACGGQTDGRQNYDPKTALTQQLRVVKMLLAHWPHSVVSAPSKLIRVRRQT